MMKCDTWVLYSKVVVLSSDPISVRSSLRSFVFVTVVWSSRLYSLALMKRKQGEREIRGNMKMRKRRECQLILRCLNKMW